MMVIPFAVGEVVRHVLTQEPMVILLYLPRGAHTPWWKRERSTFPENPAPHYVCRRWNHDAVMYHEAELRVESAKEKEERTTPRPSSETPTTERGEGQYL